MHLTRIQSEECNKKMELDEIAKILRKDPDFREDIEIVELLYFFRDNKFFNDFKNQNGIEGLIDCISRLSYLEIK